MKTFLTVTFLLFSHLCSAQTFGVRDFLVAQKLQDFELAGHFLIKYCNFSVTKDLSDSEAKCKGYQFAKGRQQIDIMRCEAKADDTEAYRFILFYRIPKDAYRSFEETLVELLITH